MIETKREWFPFLTDQQFFDLEAYFKTEPKDFMAHQISVRLGIEWQYGISIIILLQAKGLIETRLLVYHNCDPEVPVDSIKIELGYPELPWYCEECDTEVDSYSEIDFDILAKDKRD